MFFYSEAKITDAEDRSFYVKRLNDRGMTPMIFGDLVKVGSQNASQSDVTYVMKTFDGLRNKKKQNEFKFTLAPSRLP